MTTFTTSPLADLGETIQRLEQDRLRHAREIAAIDAILAQVTKAVGGLGVANAAAAEWGDGAPGLVAELSRFNPPRASKRGRFERTGEQSVLDFVRARENPTTAEINRHWREEGRKGVANVIMLRLLKAGLICREADPAIRGSRYRLASVAEASAAPASELERRSAFFDACEREESPMIAELSDAQVH
jgi:hypothetical protein